jgi:hypothetical protein
MVGCMGCTQPLDLTGELQKFVEHFGFEDDIVIGRRAR